LTTQTDKVTVQVKYKDAEKTFQGTVEETWLLLNKFFNEFIPSFEIAGKLWLNVDVQALAKDCEGLIAFSPEGPNVLAPKNKLTDNETLALWLLASYLGHKLNLLGNDALSKDELQVRLGKSGKITSTRLGELVKNDVVAKTEDEKFRITTFGIAQMQKEILPKIKAKTSN
jgi:hypothetical protein